VALVGDNVNFTCKAIGKPPPDTYSWYKNGKEMTSTGSNTNTLIIQSVTTNDSASYMCLAQSDFSVAYSNPATLLVRDDGESFCNSTPISHLKSLPKDCPQDGETPYHYDVKKC
ncbi:unnamed protein product, partial [Owenia fusiformis]